MKNSKTKDIYYSENPRTLYEYDRKFPLETKYKN